MSCKSYVIRQRGNQVKMAKLKDDQRNKAIGVLRNSFVNDVAQHFGVHQTTIDRLKRKKQQTCSVKDLQRPGRPRVTTAAEDLAIRTSHLRQRFQTAAETFRRWVGGHTISRHTVRRRQKAEGISCRRPISKDGFLQSHLNARLAWATRHVRYTQRQWQSVVISDESPFPVTKRDTRVRIYRRVNERLAPNCIRFRGDKRSAHVWGAISWWGKSDLHYIHGNFNADRYMRGTSPSAILPASPAPCSLFAGQRAAAPSLRHQGLAGCPQHRLTRPPLASQESRLKLH